MDSPLLIGQTSCTVTIGHRDGSPMTLAELRDAVAELLAAGYAESTPVDGSRFLTVVAELPALTPAAIAELLAQEPV